MILHETAETTIAGATDVAVLWNMPWHARLKNLAEALRPGLVQGARAPAGSARTWLERIRVTS